VAGTDAVASFDPVGVDELFSRDAIGRWLASGEPSGMVEPVWHGTTTAASSNG
jgi:hypothetical protein